MQFDLFSDSLLPVVVLEQKSVEYFNCASHAFTGCDDVSHGAHMDAPEWIPSGGNRTIRCEHDAQLISIPYVRREQ